MTSSPPAPPAPLEALSAPEWIELLFDADSFDERFAGVRSPDPLGKELLKIGIIHHQKSGTFLQNQIIISGPNHGSGNLLP